MITKQFVQAGRAVFTVEVPEAFRTNNPDMRPHYTFKVKFRKATQQYPDTWFVSLLTGPDNTAAYTYVGILTADGAVRLTSASTFNNTSRPVELFNKVVRRVFTNDTQPITDAGFKVHHEGQCGRCGRALTVPESIESGIGPECARVMGCGSIRKRTRKAHINSYSMVLAFLAQSSSQIACSGCRSSSIPSSVMASPSMASGTSVTSNII